MTIEQQSTMSTSEATQKLIYAIKNRILEGGWRQGSDGDWTHHGSVCLRGAYLAVCEVGGDSYLNGDIPFEARVRAKGIILDEIRDTTFMSSAPSRQRTTMVGFNDDYDRTKKQVVEMLGRAAQRVRP